MSVLKINSENYQNEIMESEKPVLLDFFAEWCGPCKMLGPVIEEIAAENSQFKVGKVNIDEQPELVKQFRIMSVPTLVVLKDGQVADRSVGVIPKQQILSMLA